MRLIDGDAFNAYLQDEYHGAISDSELKVYQIMRLIDNAPTIDQIPVKLIREMQHAIGWRESRVTGTKKRVMHAYRNRFFAPTNEAWESLCFFGLAKIDDISDDGRRACYVLTRKGLDFLGDLCGLKIVEVD